MAEITRLTVGAEKPYPVVIGRKLLEDVPQFLEGAKKGARSSPGRPCGIR